MEDFSVISRTSAGCSTLTHLAYAFHQRGDGPQVEVVKTQPSPFPCRRLKDGRVRAIYSLRAARNFWDQCCRHHSSLGSCSAIPHAMLYLSNSTLEVGIFVLFLSARKGFPHSLFIASISMRCVYEDAIMRMVQLDLELDVLNLVLIFS